MASRVLIFGTGSVGACYAYALSRALPAKNIVTICRSNYEAALKTGFTINSTIWGQNLNVRPTVVKSVAEAAQDNPHGFDYAVVCSKAILTQPSTAELLKPAISSKTAIVLVQNGINIEEDFAKLYPDNPILSTVVYMPATQVSPAVIEHKEIELLHVGTYPSDAPQPQKDAAKAFVDLIKAANASAELHDDIQTQRWKKLLVNCAWNPICALTRSGDRNFLNSSPDAELFIRDVMAEIAAVAQACGQPSINKDVIDFQVSRALARAPPGVQPSMLADALDSRNMEVDAIIGNVVKLAKQHNIQTPLLRAVANLIRGLDYGFSRA